jgi:hypothetical protein
VSTFDGKIVHPALVKEAANVDGAGN